MYIDLSPDAPMGDAATRLTLLPEDSHPSHAGLQYYAEEAYRRAQEFRQLPPEGRWREIAALMEWGLNLARTSPQRAAIEQRWQAQEEEWQRIQQELFAQNCR